MVGGGGVAVRPETPRFLYKGLSLNLLMDCFIKLYGTYNFMKQSFNRSWDRPPQPLMRMKKRP